MTFLKGVPGAVDDVGVAYQNDIEDDRSLIWETFGRRQGVARGLVMTLDVGTLSVTFSAGSAVVEQRGTDINGDTRGYYVYFDASFQVVFDAPSAATRNDAVVVCWADPQYGALGASVDGPGPQVVVVKGVSGTTTPRTDTEINTAIGPGGWFRFADVKIDNGDTQVNSVNVTRTGQTIYEAARVRRNTAFTIPTGSVVPIGWDTVVSDGGGMVPTVANGIKVTSGGKYRIGGAVALDFASGTNLLHVVLRVNGTDTRVVYRGDFSGTALNPFVASFSYDEVELAANDVVTLAIFHNRGSNVLTYVAQSIYMTELAVRKLGSV